MTRLDPIEIIMRARDEAAGILTKSAQGVNRWASNVKGSVRGVRDDLTQLSAASGFTDLNQGLELALKGFRAVERVVDSTVGAIVRSLEALSEQAAEVDNQSRALGLNVEKWQEWLHIANIADVPAEKVAVAFRFLQKNANDMANGTGEARQAFKELNIEVEESPGKLRPVESLLEEVFEKLASTEDMTKRTALSMRLLGESGSALAPIYDQGSAALERTREKARDLNVMSAETIARFREMKDAIAEAKAALQGATRDALEPFTGGIRDAAEDAKTFIQENRDLMKEYGAFLKLTVESTLGAIKQLVEQTGLPALTRFLADASAQAGTAFAAAERMTHGAGADLGPQSLRNKADFLRLDPNAGPSGLGDIQLDASAPARPDEGGPTLKPVNVDKLIADAQRASQELVRLRDELAMAEANGFDALNIRMEQELRKFEGNEEAKGLIRERFRIAEQDLFAQEFQRKAEVEQLEEDRAILEAERMDAKLEHLREHYLTRSEILAEAEERDLAIAGDNAALRSRIEQRYAGERGRIAQSEQNARLSAAAGMFTGLNALAQAAGIQSTATQKGFAIAQATIAFQVAKAKALAEEGPVAGFAMIGAIAGFAASILSAINSASPTGGAAGGLGSFGGIPGGGSFAPPQAPPSVTQPERIDPGVTLHLAIHALDTANAVEILKPALEEATRDGRVRLAATEVRT